MYIPMIRVSPPSEANQIYKTSYVLVASNESARPGFSIVSARSARWARGDVEGIEEEHEGNLIWSLGNRECNTEKESEI